MKSNSKSKSNKDDDNLEIIEVENAAQFNDIVKDSSCALIDFYADWCGPCKIQSRILRERYDVLRFLFPELIIYSFDVDRSDTHKKIASTLKIRAIPQLILISDQKLHGFDTGLNQLTDIIKILQDKLPDHLKRPKEIANYLSSIQK